MPLRLGSLARIGGSDKCLARTYPNVQAIFCQSKYEGFSILQLEAESSDCVVASLNASSIPVIVGEAVAIIEFTGIDNSRQGFEGACLSESTLTHLLFASADRVRLSIWDRCAHGTSAAYRRVISG